jgi:hypothetical protein
MEREEANVCFCIPRQLLFFVTVESSMNHSSNNSVLCQKVKVKKVSCGLSQKDWV